MATTSSRKTKSLTYFILYGFIGGKAHSRKFRKQLGAQGLQPTDDAGRADVLIAHSAGCFMVPKQTKAQLILLVGVPLQTKTVPTFLRAHRNNLRTFVCERKLLHGFKIGLNSSYYGITRPRKNFRIARMVNKKEVTFPDGTRTQVVWLTNQYDPWPKAPALQDYIEREPYSFLSLGGSHDDIWTDPKPYIAILETYVKRLLVQAGK